MYCWSRHLGDLETRCNNPNVFGIFCKFYEFTYADGSKLKAKGRIKWQTNMMSAND